MATKLFLVIVVVVGSMLAGCQGRVTTSPEQNVFYNITHQAETFGFTEETFNQLQAIFSQHTSHDFKSTFYYYNYGCGYYHTKKLDEQTALKYADSMLLLVQDKANTKTDQAEIAIANLSEGDILFALKRYNEAWDYYYNGKLAAEKSGDQYTLSEYSYRLGMATYKKEQYDAAARYFVDAFEQAGHRNNSFSDFYRRQEVLDNAALSYLHSGKADSAIWYCNKGLRYIADNEGKHTADKKELIQAAYGVLYGTMGRAYLQLHDTTGAGVLQQSIAINGLPGRENGDALQLQACLAQYYLDTTFSLQLPRGHKMLMAIQRGLDTLHSADVAIRWNELMSRYYALQGNKAEAYTYLTRYNTLHDEQIAANKALAETNINSRLKMMQDRYEMSLLKANNQLKTIYLQIAILLCVLTGAILFLIVRNWKKEKENSHTLAALNKQIQQQTMQLEVTVKQLDQQIKAKDYILRVIAHDLRNPISAISTLTRIVSEEYENEEDNKEFLEMAQSACKDSLAMIDSIMQLSQQNQPDTLKWCVFDINKSVLDCVELLRCKAEEKRQEIVLHTAKTPQYTLGDADKINRVVNNLVMNAIKFSFPNSTIDVYIKDKKDKVEIEVRDQGIGIPADMQAKVFDVFTEAKRKGTSKEATFGLGLSICKQLVEAHDGKIWLESKEGLGSAFYVQLHKHSLSPSQSEPELKAEAV
ncbi:HAMP domain-containing histidine kinase [Ilyomonas limi]|uniref:histidine kinase n=1 Tax=Ilyomonas limi TaxID=2575867 RepID=A0A4U3KXU5_9BACT|nr:HAMP domain-containing sensor histidine kinase [Ilyomonas limi]TKK66679.1 HAMP domain-containing histidine kinase [Ilyomonas limi]